MHSIKPRLSLCEVYAEEDLYRNVRILTVVFSFYFLCYLLMLVPFIIFANIFSMISME